jgi:tripeptidyl-peptidase I
MSGQIQSSTPTSKYQGIAVLQSVCFFMIFAPLSTAQSVAVHGQWKHRDDYYTQDSALLMQRNPHHEIVFAIKQKNLEKLEEITMQVSDPTSTMYGKHLTHDAVHRMTANPAAAAAVRAWSKQYPALLLKDTSSHDEYLTFDAPLSTWNEILTTKFVKMQHTETGEALIRSPSFTMPAELEQHVAHMFNVVELPLRKGPGVQVRKMTPIEKKNDLLELTELTAARTPYPWPCKSTMKLGCWNYRYNQTTNDATGETQMVFGQKGAYTALDDITQWAGANQLNPLGTAQVWSCPNGGCSNSACQGYDPNMKNKGHLCVEGNMDVQFMSGIAQNANNTFYWNTNLQTPFIEFITHISSLADPPGTVSISYGSYEYEMDHAVMDHFSLEAMKLGAQGVTILAATGDDGVAGYKARNDTKQCKYTASFPATCPWVTSVGATQNAENDPDDHEVRTLQEYAANAPEQQPPFFAVTTA